MYTEVQTYIAGFMNGVEPVLGGAEVRFKLTRTIEPSLANSAILAYRLRCRTTHYAESHQYYVPGARRAATGADCAAFVDVARGDVEAAGSRRGHGAAGRLQGSPRVSTRLPPSRSCPASSIDASRPRLGSRGWRDEAGGLLLARVGRTRLGGRLGADALLAAEV